MKMILKAEHTEEAMGWIRVIHGNHKDSMFFTDVEALKASRYVNANLVCPVCGMQAYIGLAEVLVVCDSILDKTGVVEFEVYGFECQGSIK